MAEMFGLSSPVPMTMRMRPRKNVGCAKTADSAIERWPSAMKHAARPDRAPQSEPAVGDPSAGQRREVDAGRVDADDGRRGRASEAEPTARERRRHEEDEERADPVVREPLPHLGEEQRRETARMAEEAAVVDRGRRLVGVSALLGCGRSSAWSCGHAAARCSAARGRKNSGGFVPPAARWSSQLTVVGGCLMHAAQWPGAFSSSGGTISAHAASRAGCWQRGWKTQPARRIRRRRDVAREQDALALHAGLRRGHRGEQRLRVRHDRLAVQLRPPARARRCGRGTSRRRDRRCARRRRGRAR